VWSAAAAIKAHLLEEYVTGAVLDALESPRVAAGIARRCGSATMNSPRFTLWVTVVL